MSYQYDVFISYRSEKNAWTPWARTFRAALESCLQRELGNPPAIFIDHQTPVGANYVNHLAGMLAKSKVLVALLSKDYFSSDWCVHELDLMMERACGIDLIIPVLVHDGKTIPDTVAQLQVADFVKYAIPGLSPVSPLHAEFWIALGVLAPRIGEAVEAAPEFDSHWEPLFKQRFIDVYAASTAGNRVVPKQFTLKMSTPPKAPPRMSL
jgi:TIR domain